MSLQFLKLIGSNCLSVVQPGIHKCRVKNLCHPTQMPPCIVDTVDINIEISSFIVVVCISRLVIKTKIWVSLCKVTMVKCGTA